MSRIKISRLRRLIVAALREHERMDETEEREETKKRRKGGRKENLMRTDMDTDTRCVNIPPDESGRLIAQSRIIRGFRVTKPRRGGLYQLEREREHAGRMAA